LIGWLVKLYLLVGCLVGWLVGWLVGCLVGWLVGWIDVFKGLKGNILINLITITYV